MISIIPMGAPRQTNRDRWKGRPVVLRYHAFRDELRLKYKKDLPLSLQLVFYMPIPASYSQKKRQDLLNQPHNEKPDIDNLVKAVLDTLAPEDKTVWRVYAEKYWSDTPGIEIEHIE